MKRYEYVDVDLTIGFIHTKLEKHRDVIDDYARRGYKYVGYIPTKIDNDGAITQIDLIFEIDI